jgi:hypothetical protein
MDIFSRLFGDPADDTMYVQVPVMTGVATRTSYGFDPSSASGKQWLEKLAAKISSAGKHCPHISNNAPRDICDLDVDKRRTGVAIAKKWIDGAKLLGVKSMRVNRGGPRSRHVPAPRPTIRRMTSFRTLLDAGIHTAAGSDFSPRPFIRVCRSRGWSHAQVGTARRVGGGKTVYEG